MKASGAGLTVPPYFSPSETLREIDGFWFPTKYKLEPKQVREWIANSVDWELAIPHIKNWECAVDGGAHVGLWTIRLAGHFRTVHAFEPDPDNFEALALNVKNNKNVILHNVALAESKREAKLDGDISTSRYLSRGSGVQVWPLDTFGLLPGFIKLDVEGCESLALQGAVETLKSKPVVMFEEKHYERYKQPHPSRFLPGYREITRVRRDRIYIHDGA